MDHFLASEGNITIMHVVSSKSRLHRVFYFFPKYMTEYNKYKICKQKIIMLIVRESELSYIKMLKIIRYANIPHVCDVEV